MAGRRKWLALRVLVGLMAWFLLSERTTEDVTPPVTVEVPEEPITTRTAPLQAALEEEPSEEDPIEKPYKWSTVDYPLTLDAPYEGEVRFTEHFSYENSISHSTMSAEISDGHLQFSREEYAHMVDFGSVPFSKKELLDVLSPGGLEVPGYPAVE